MPTRLQTSRLLLLPLLFVVGCHGARPVNLGVRDGRLPPCPLRPNCVSSQAPDDAHRVAPLAYSGSPEDAMKRLAAIIRSLPRTEVITDAGTYLHVEFKSVLFRFIDDAEFLVDGSTRVIHVRSASRLGLYDFGVNSRRVELIRKRWLEPMH